jgi:hypothetical protein
MGIGAGVYFDFATFSFHVPSVLSAPRAATVVIASAISALVRIVRICHALVNFNGRGCLKFQWCPFTAPIRHRWWEAQLTLIAPNSIPVDQLQGSDDITGGNSWEDRWRGDLNGLSGCLA